MRSYLRKRPMWIGWVLGVLLAYVCDLLLLFVAGEMTFVGAIIIGFAVPWIFLNYWKSGRKQS